MNSATLLSGVFVPTDAALSDAEQCELAVCESVIERNLAAFYEMGQALQRIRDERLYRQTHGTFEEYCGERWGISRPRAYQLIDAAVVVENLSTMVDKPGSERQARELASLEPEQQRDVWQAAVESAPDGKVTAQHIRETRDAMTQPSTADEKENKDWDEGEGYLGECFKQCYGPRWMRRGSVLEFDTTGVYVCTGCDYAYPPGCEPDPWSESEEEDEETVPSIQPVKPHVAQNSGNNEWYTPPEFIEAAYAVMEEIDLDPASSEIANQTVKATRIFTQQDNGLQQEWAGSVWMNPPYAGELIGQFIQKFVDHALAGDISEGIILVNNATETGWFQNAASVASAICFPKTRIRFISPDGIHGAPLQGQAILYTGLNYKLFKEEFSRFGFVVVL
jgi:hypothetical protein